MIGIDQLCDLEATLPLKPTRAELVILTVLWENGPSTVRAVHEAMPAENVSGYTTILKLLQIMYGKGLVTRDDSRRAHVYQPVSSRTEVQNQLMLDLVQRAFDSAPVKLALNALANVQSVSTDELKKVHKLVQRLEAQHDQELN